MTDTVDRAIAIVGVGSILPDAPDTSSFWSNLQAGRYSISEVPSDRWNLASYYDADPHSPLEKSYSKIGGWVQRYAWDPARWKLPIPPKVGDAMDVGQKWALTCTREALLDFGYPDRPLDRARTAVILGNAMAGEKHYLTGLRVFFPEFAHALATAPSFAALDPHVRAAIEVESRAMLGAALPPITEDSMPGELSNCIAGRVANLFDFHGPNYVVDAACASAMAAMAAAIEGLIEHDYDAVLTGGIDRNMGPSSFVKFCKIGALSATGTRPYADGADGFVMGEGGVVMMLKRLADAERANDRIYAVVRGVGGASDGKGKGLTAPNPIGQKLAIERAWDNAGLAPDTASLIEGHGTSTRVGDVVEVEALSEVLRAAGARPGSIALGSVKSNIGHLKAAAGAAGLLKVALALFHKTLPPSLNFSRPNPNIDFERSPLAVNTALRPWTEPSCAVRRAGVSAFGFGGTNFHAVLEEHVPGALTRSRRTTSAGVVTSTKAARVASASAARPPLRGALVLGAASLPALAERLASVQRAAATGHAPAIAPPARSELEAPERIAIDFGDAAEFADKAGKALKAVRSNDPAAWRMLRQQGVFAGRGPRGKLAFLFTGQGSQYTNMLAALRASEPIVAETFVEADRVMTPLLGGRPLSSYIFTDANDPAARAQAEEELKQTAITQPALLATDIALTRLLAAYGIHPDLVMGHSLGEYGALVSAGVLSFADALEAVSARGREMANLDVGDHGWMVAVTAPLEAIEAVVAATSGYVVIANINSPRQSVIGGASAAVEQAMQALVAKGYPCVRLPVSHAFHTQIVAPASTPLRTVLERLDVRPPRVPVIANVTGELYPSGEHARAEIVELLSRQVASPVQFVKGLETLYTAGVRAFVEVGPKRALAGLAEDTLGHHADVVTMSTNHPKLADAVAFNQALCGLYAAGFGAVEVASAPAIVASPGAVVSPSQQPVVITGAALGVPGTPRVFDDANLARMLRGESLIDVVPARHRRAMVDKHITRVVKGDDGSASFKVIDDPDDVIRLAGRGGALDLEADFGVSAERLAALDVVTQLAIGAGLDALRDAGIPLVHRYKTTSKGTQLPDRWGLPDALRDDTGVIFASAFPGLDAFADELGRYHADVGRREKLALLDKVIAHLGTSADPQLRAELVYQRDELRAEQERDAYQFDRRFLFRVLSMGHSQFAELIGARGPNTQINAACASTTQAVAVAEDWIRAGRCRRVIIIAGDDVTSDHLIEWMGAGFLSSGAAATDDVVEKAALPFDRRRHGMIMGMGAAALIVESAESARERGLDPIAEVLGAVTANSAFHGTRLDLEHIGQVMASVVRMAETSGGVARAAMAAEMVFVSHETYTPARGGSASAEIHALREVFGDAASHIVIANTKGMTGHSMGVGLEDVVALKALETGVIPPVPNFKEVDPELGSLNLSHGGPYPIRYALRLGAGFGSQISMTLMRWVPTPDGKRPSVAALGYDYRVRDRAAWSAWLARVSGLAVPQVEVVKRTLRVIDQGPRKLAVPAPPPSAQLQPAASMTMPAVAVPPPPRAPSVAATQPRVPAPVDAVDTVKQKVMSIVAATTGYPPDMLDEGLDLEADLGVDTVKQAETFAAVRAAYEIPRQDNLKLRDFPTIAHVVQFVHTHRPDLRPAPSAPATPVVGRAAATVAAAPTSAVTLAPAAETPAGGDDPVKARVLAIIAEKTGYPPDMLDEGLDLEADLGVDTVKQAETFAAVRAAYEIPRQDNLKLRDFPTIAHVVQFVYTNRPDLAPGAASHVVPDAAPPAVPQSAAGFPRRVPMPVLRPALELCKPTGVTLGHGARVLILRDMGGVAEALVARLTARGVETIVADAGWSSEDLLQRLHDAGPLTGVYWLAALDDEGDLHKLDLAGFRDALRHRFKRLATVARQLYDTLANPGTFVVGATRLGGAHGYDAAGATAPLGGAVTGFIKALAREREAALCKAVDFAADAPPDRVAEALLAETLADPGAVEIGRVHSRRIAIGLVESPLDPEVTPRFALSPASQIVVTGAAGSIVAAITADLAARAGGGTFHLIDLAPAPDAADRDLQWFERDREGLKRDLFERLKARGERATPAMIERELAVLERKAAAQAAITAITRAGGTAHYHQVDLGDGAAVATAMADVRATGRLDLLVHAAGLEISHFLPDKPDKELDRVFDVKADGWFNLLAGLGDAALGAVVVFGSIAGRFGNGGQTDYSAANDLLCKLVSNLQRTRVGVRGVAIDWTAWSGIGMASRGSIPKMIELAGIDMLPPSIGIPAVYEELVRGGGEVVVAGRLGALVRERDPEGGLELTRVATARGPMIDHIAGMGLYAPLVAETTLDPTREPFLDHHRIDGTAVLPGVMGIEGFAELAAAIVPGSRVVAVEAVRFEAPFKFYRDEPRTLRIEAWLHPDGDEIVAACRLVGVRRLVGRDEPQLTTHFTGRVRLTTSDAWPEVTATRVSSPNGEPAVDGAGIYKVYFHGPAYQVLEAVWTHDDAALGRMPEQLPPDIREGVTLLDPRSIELCFQTAGIWDMRAHGGRMALPRGVDELRWLGPHPKGSLTARVVRRDDGSFDAEVADVSGTPYLRLRGYRTIAVDVGESS